MGEAGTGIPGLLLPSPKGGPTSCLSRSMGNRPRTGSGALFSQGETLPFAFRKLRSMSLRFVSALSLKDDFKPNGLKMFCLLKDK